MSNTQNLPGSVAINNISVWTPNNPAGNIIDLTPYFNSLVIFEDIWSPMISGNLSFIDSEDIYTFLPILGEETIYISFTSPFVSSNYSEEEAQKFTWSGEFMLTKVLEVTPINDSINKVTVSFISKEAFFDTINKFSRSFSGTPSEIALQLLNGQETGLNTSKTINCSESINNIGYVSNYWSPLRNMQYLSENALDSNSFPGFVFFENKFGFNFVSIPEVIKNTKDADAKSGYKIIKHYMKFDRGGNVDFKTGGSTVNYVEEFSKILKIHPRNHSGYLDKVNQGILGTTLFWFDLNNADSGSQKSTLNYNDFFASYEHLNPNPNIGRNLPYGDYGRVYVKNIQSNFKNANPTTPTKTNDEILDETKRTQEEIQINIDKNKKEIAELKSKKQTNSSDKERITFLENENKNLSKKQTDLNDVITKAQSAKTLEDSSKEYSKISDEGKKIKYSAEEIKNGIKTTYIKTVDEHDNLLSASKVIIKNGQTNESETWNYTFANDSIIIDYKKPGAASTKQTIAKINPDKTENREYTNIVQEIMNGSKIQEITTDPSNGPSPESVDDAPNTNIEYFLKRRAFISAFNDETISFDVYGSADTTVGSLMYVSVPKSKQLYKQNANDWLDEAKSGYFLVTAVKHQIALNSYKCTIEGTKESSVRNLG